MRGARCRAHCSQVGAALGCCAGVAVLASCPWLRTCEAQGPAVPCVRGAFGVPITPSVCDAWCGCHACLHALAWLQCSNALGSMSMASACLSHVDMCGRLWGVHKRPGRCVLQESLLGRCMLSVQVSGFMKRCLKLVRLCPV